MHNELQLPDEQYGFITYGDLEFDEPPYISCKPLSGRVVVTPAKAKEKWKGIHLPDKIKGDTRSDVCKVTHIGSDVDGLEIGDTVVVKAYDGKWIEEDGKEYRIYGSEAENKDDVRTYPWYWSVIAKMNSNVLDATGDNLIIRRKPLQRQESGIYLPDVAHFHEPKGTVISVGPEVDEVKVGDEVIYLNSSITILGNWVNPDEYEDLILVPESGILVKLLEAS